MDESFIASLAPYNCQIALLAPTFDCFRIENQLEETLLKGIEEYRHKNKQSFVHDEILSSYLATALANYEIERITGQTFCE